MYRNWQTLRELHPDRRALAKQINSNTTVEEYRLLLKKLRKLDKKFRRGQVVRVLVPRDRILCCPDGRNPYLAVYEGLEPYSFPFRVAEGDFRATGLYERKVCIAILKADGRRLECHPGGGGPRRQGVPLRWLSDAEAAGGGVLESSPPAQRRRPPQSQRRRRALFPKADEMRAHGLGITLK